MDLTLLEISQIFGEKALSIFKKYGTKAAITDFPILLGGYVSDLTLNNSDELKDRTGYYWTKTDDRDNDAHCVHDNGWSDYSNRVYNRRLGIRPTLLFVSIPSVSLNEVRGNDGVLRVEYGEYPQYAVDKIEQNILEGLYNSNSLNQTGKRYTTDSRKCNEYAKGFRPQYHIEYEYNGRKFVRVIANSCFTTKIFSLSNRDIFQLSNGEYYENGDAVWVEVTPITWLVDKNEDIAVSEKIIIAGIQFNEKSNYEGYFSKTNMYKFMNNFLIKDIIPSKINKLNTIEDNNKQEIIETLKKVELLEKEISEIESKKEELISTKARLRELMGIVIDDNGDTKGNQKVKKHEIESSK